MVCKGKVLLALTHVYLLCGSVAASADEHKSDEDTICTFLPSMFGQDTVISQVGPMPFAGTIPLGGPLPFAVGMPSSLLTDLHGVDENNDSVISKAEYLRRQEENFKRLDLNNDDELTLNEVLTHINPPALHMNSSQVPQKKQDN